jgi:uncharacterized protein (TIGR01777 family)
MEVAITGAGGLIGSALVPFLRTGGHAVTRLVRRAPAADDEIRWDPDRGAIDADALEGVDAVVNLAGENLGEGRWSERRKALFRDSRVDSTRLLAETLARMKRRPKVLLSASAIGYYGSRGDEWLTEETPPADDFLGRLVRDWEAAAAPASAVGIRVVHPRMGMVLSPAGGALGKMLLPFRMGLGGVLGSGRQYMSWVAIDDVLGVFHHALVREDLAGPVNAVTPVPVTNTEFTRTLGRVLGRPTIAPVPAVVLRLVFGEMADATILSSIRVRPGKLVATGYHFRFPELEPALRHVLGKTRA